jgi:hypothetical protein
VDATRRHERLIPYPRAGADHASDYQGPLAAKSRLSRSSRLGTHTRSIQAHLRAARSSPPRPLLFCIVDMQSRFSEGLPHHTQPMAIGFEAAFLQ